MGYDLTLERAKGKTWIATLIEPGLRGHGSKGGHVVEYDGGGDMVFFLLLSMWTRFGRGSRGKGCVWKCGGCGMGWYC